MNTSIWLLLVVIGPFALFLLAVVYDRARCWKRRRWALGQLVRHAGLEPKVFETQAQLRRRYAEHVSMTKP